MKKQTPIHIIPNQSPQFSGVVDSIDMLERIDRLILDIQTHENGHKAVYDALDRYQLLILRSKDDTRWINSNFEATTETKTEPLTKRIHHLIKTRGEWLNDETRKSSITIETCATLPLNIPVTQHTREQIVTDDASSLVTTLVAIQEIIKESVHREKTSCGIFTAPDGTVNMNRQKLWLDSQRRKGIWESTNEIDVVTLREVVETARFTS